MAVVIVYTLIDNVIHGIYDGAISYEDGKVSYFGGSMEGFDPNEVGVIITNDITTEFRMIDTPVIVRDESGNPEESIELVNTLIFLDVEGNRIVVGDSIPVVTDIKEEFIITDESAQRIADLELMIIEIIGGGGGV